MTRAAVFVFALTVCLAAPALAEEAESYDWPQYRGVERDGVSPETGLLDAWPEDGPKVVWRRPLGSGFSGIAVAGGRLFTMFSEGGKEYAAAFDPADGKELWRLEVGEEFKSEFGHGPRSTPAVAGGLAFFLGSYGDLVAVDASSGEKQWHLSLMKDFGSQLPNHGYSTAPMIEGKLLVVEIGGGRGKAFAALDQRTGKTLWTTQDGRPSYTSPIAVDLGGERQLVSIGERGLVSFDHKGELNWLHPWQHRPIAMPVFVAPDKLFISNNGGGALMVRVKEEGDEVVIEELWRSNQMRNHFNSSVVVGDHLYGFDNATLRCVAIADGERAWSRRGFGRGSLIAADGHLIVLGERGTLAMAKATAEGYDEVGRVQVFDGKSWTAPTLAGGRLYLRDLEEMVALDLKTGS